MKIGAIVAEFNPFHNGHAALITAARAAGMTHVVAVMSGSFVQRGESAIADKYLRTRCALASGVDMVLELPLPYAAATAQRFAGGAVTLLRATRMVDTLVFGSEAGDASALQLLAREVDSPAVEQAIGVFLAEGMTFARARQLAVEQVSGKPLADMLAAPNNALAVEYLRQAHRLEWEPDLFTIPRLGVAHDAAMPRGNTASASYIRRHALDFYHLGRYMPDATLKILRDAHDNGLYPADFSRLGTAILAHLRRLPPEILAGLPDLSEGLENRLYNAIRAASSLEELYMMLKTKRYTLARVRRLVLVAFLGITAQDLSTSPPYIRVLGFRESARELMGLLGRSAALPVGTSLLPLSRLSPTAGRLATLEETAGDLYALALPQPRPCGYELRAKVEVL